MAKSTISNEEKALHDSIMGRKKQKRKGFVRKNTSQTFWNEIRIRNGYTVKEVADCIECSVANMSKYMIGNVMPSRTTSDKISDLFGVDREEGYTRFKNSYETYHNTHGKTVEVAPKKNIPTVNDAVDKYIEKPEVIEKSTKVNEPETILSATDKLLMALYEVLDWRQYRELVWALGGHSNDINWDEVEDLCYGKVDKEIYATLLKLKG